MSTTTADIIAEIIREQLDPQTEGERATVDWLCSTLSTPGSLDQVKDMLLRNVSATMTVGYREGLTAALEAVAKRLCAYGLDESQTPDFNAAVARIAGL